MPFAFRPFVHCADYEKKPKYLEALGGDGWQAGFLGVASPMLAFSLEDGVVSKVIEYIYLH
jgi:hypothetical protein